MGQEFRVGIGASALQDSYLAALQACDQALQDCPEPQVAIVFGSIFNNQEAVLRGLNQKLPAEIILGGSSFAEISTAGVSESSVCVMLLSIPGGSFVRSKAGLQDNSLDVGRKLAQGLKYNMSRPVGLMFGSNGVHHGCEGLYLQGLEEGLGCIPVIGGATSGNFLLSMNDPEILVNYQYGGGSLERQSVDVGLLDLGPEMEVGFGWSHGWSPVAPPMTITRADGNKVYEVNGIPILDFYRQYIGADESRFFDYFLRRYGFCLLLGDNESQLTAAKIPSMSDLQAGYIGFYPAENMAGKKVQLIQSSRHDLIRGAKQAAICCMEGLKGKKPSAVIAISCALRRQILHSRTSIEVEAIKEVFGSDVPLIGFYSMGEFAPILNRYEDICNTNLDLHGSHHHGTTIALMALYHPRAKAPQYQHSALQSMVLRRDDRALLRDSELILEDTEKFLSNLSRENYFNAEKIREQKEALETKQKELIAALDHNMKLQTMLQSYTPKVLWNKADSSVSRGEYALCDEEVQMTFLFMDIKGFTNFAEKNTPAKVIEEINHIFTQAVQSIHSHQGDIDKFIGDCIFAAFPTARGAVESAISIQTWLKSLSDCPFSLRIGIHTGRAVRGNVGSRDRMEHTYIGDAVNLTQRLEANCRPGGLLLTRECFDKIENLALRIEQDFITIKGKTEPVRVVHILV